MAMNMIILVDILHSKESYYQDYPATEHLSTVKCVLRTGNDPPTRQYIETHDGRKREAYFICRPSCQRWWPNCWLMRRPACRAHQAPISHPPWLVSLVSDVKL